MTKEEKQSYLTHEYHKYVTDNNINSVILGGSAVGLFYSNGEVSIASIIYILLFFYACFALVTNGVKISDIVEKSEDVV